MINHTHTSIDLNWMIICFLIVVVTFVSIHNHIMIMSIRRNTILTNTNNNRNTTTATVDSSSSSSTNRTNSSSSNNNRTTDIASIAFLFLADRPMNEDMWERWFDDADDHRMYSIYVHYGKSPVQVNTKQQEQEQQRSLQVNNTNGMNSSSNAIQNTTTTTISMVIPFLGSFFLSIYNTIITNRMVLVI